MKEGEVVGRKNILLIEDDYLDVIQVQRALNKLKADCELHTAFNGKDALDMLRGIGPKKLTSKPDIILLDINMPKMNGLELLKEIRSAHELQNIPVFIMSTSFEEVDREEAEKSGVSGYISKPLDFESYGTGATAIDTFNLLLVLLK